MATNFFGNIVRASRQLATNLIVPYPGLTVVKLGAVPAHCFEITKLKLCNVYQAKKLELSLVASPAGLVISTTTAPVIVFPDGSIARTDMVLSPPSDPTCSAEVVLINGSANTQEFNNISAISNVQGPNFKMGVGSSNKMVWNPCDNLWYAIPQLFP